MKPGPYDLLRDGLRKMRQGEPFLAHEAFEDAWRNLRDGAHPGAIAAKALAQLAAAAEKAKRRERAGTDRLIEKTLGTLASCRTSELGIDLVQVRRSLERAKGQGFDDVRAELETRALPESTASKGVLYLHGFASSPSSAKATNARKLFDDQRITFRAPDLEEGDFQTFTVTRAIEVAARNIFDETVVVGSSLGGYVATLLAQRDPRVRGLLLMAPAFDFAPRMAHRHGVEVLAAWKERGHTEVDHHARGRRESLAYGFVEDARRHDPRPPIRVVARIVHGTSDDVVPIGSSRDVAARDQVPLWEVDDDHALARSSAVIDRAALEVLSQALLRTSVPD